MSESKKVKLTDAEKQVLGDLLITLARNLKIRGVLLVMIDQDGELLYYPMGIAAEAYRLFNLRDSIDAAIETGVFCPTCFKNHPITEEQKKGAH